MHELQKLFEQEATSRGYEVSVSSGAFPGTFQGNCRGPQKQIYFEVFFDPGTTIFEFKGAFEPPGTDNMSAAIHNMQTGKSRQSLGFQFHYRLKDGLWQEIGSGKKYSDGQLAIEWCNLL